MASKFDQHNNINFLILTARKHTNEWVVIIIIEHPKIFLRKNQKVKVLKRSGKIESLRD
jgi:hypothetical protein